MAEPDLSEFIAASKPNRLRCGVALVLRDLPPARRRLLEAALEANPRTITHAGIEAELAKWGVKLADSTIGRHRNGKCSCD